MMRHLHRGRLCRCHLLLTLMLMLLCGALLASAPGIRAEGSRDLFPRGDSGFRANIEWRTSTYGALIPRRTLFNVYARTGEFIVLGSSAVDAGGSINAGDIVLYEPDTVRGAITTEQLPATPAFSCLDQRALPGNAGRGRIASRAEELAGPLPAAGGYAPCYYQAPRDGIYVVVFYGPAGPGSDSQTPPSGRVEAIAADFGPTQNTSVTAWDVGVRSSLSAPAELGGRVFSYYVAMFAGGNGRPVTGTAFIPTRDGFVYKVDYNGDPNGFMIYSNSYGFLNTDGTPLYHDVLAVPTLGFQEQNQLVQLQGGVRLDLPEHPLFLSPPDPIVLDALGIPRQPQPPLISNLDFMGAVAPNITLVDKGGTFNFDSSGSGVYAIVISQDGKNFEPDNLRNRVLRGIITRSGPVTLTWDGRDNEGLAFPVGQGYLARIVVQGGEVHFPFLDVENNLAGGPTITLTNPPGGVCPSWNGGCSGAFYDDLGYKTAAGTLVGTAVDGDLCRGGTGNPPALGASDPLLGFDTRTTQRAFGFRSGGNPESICLADGGFGDKKGLDLWTFYPSNIEVVPIRIVEPAAIALRSFTADLTPQGVALRWETSAEAGTYGFHLYRSSDGTRAAAERITAAPIAARGAGQGAVYEWLDTTAAPGVRYSYWLQEIEIDGTTNEYGPAVVSN